MKQNALVLQQKLDVNREKAFLLAKQKGWETLRVTKEGAILTTHTEFAPDRIKTKDNATTISSHSTHVARTIMASGI